MSLDLDTIQSQFARGQKSHGKLSPHLLKWDGKFREKFLKKAKELDVPSKKIESWKYSSVKNFDGLSFSVVDKGPSQELSGEQLSKHTSQEDICLVFVDGRFSNELSVNVNPDVLVVGSIGELLSQEESKRGFSDEELSGWLSELSDQKWAKEDSEFFCHLNSSVYSDGAFILIPPSVSVEKTIRLVYFSSQNSDFGRYSKNVVVVGDRSKAEVVEVHVGTGDNVGTTNVVTDLIVGMSSSLSYVRAQDESESCGHFGAVRGKVLKDGRLDVFNLSLGGKFQRNDVHIFLEGEGAHVESHGLYLSHEAQHLANRSAIYHQKPRTVSRQLYKGILADESKCVFNGKVFIAQDAQQVDSNQLNNNLVIGDKAEADTKPELEVYADDVIATHGSTVGQMSSSELFYLESRGIAPEEAKAMIARGFVEEVILKIPSKKLRVIVDKLVDDRFDEFSQQIKERLGGNVS